MIKLFEEFSNQYGKISFKEYSLMLQQIPPKVFIPFNDKEKEEISQFGEYRGSLGIHFIKFSIRIYKMPDEWYYVGGYGYTDGPIYYKCDEFQGLINCLKHLIERFY